MLERASVWHFFDNIYFSATIYEKCGAASKLMVNF